LGQRGEIHRFEVKIYQIGGHFYFLKLLQHFVPLLLRSSNELESRLSMALITSWLIEEATLVISWAEVMAWASCWTGCNRRQKYSWQIFLFFFAASLSERFL